MAKNIDAMKAFIESADRLAKALGETNPRDDDFDTLLHRHERLCTNALRYMDIQERVGFFLSEMDELEVGEPMDGAKITPIPVNPAEVPKAEPTTEPEPAAEEKPEPVPATEEKPAPAQTITFAEVKSAFTAAAREGVKVAEIINDAGYTKLSDVPESKYAALMTALSAKTAEA